MLNITSIIDHTLLKPEATKEMIEKLCSEAKEYNFFSVCINPYYVKTAKEELEGSNVKIATVIGFPLGSTPKEVKAFEASEAIKNGADELDMVINIGALKDGDYTTVEEDIKAVVNEATDKALVKVIIETCLLDDEEKKKACEIARAAGADFVKTSTGFSTGGATVEDVKLMREVVGEDLGVKASGGIRDYETAKKMVEAGASRIGASSSIEIAKAMNK
ncbi:deoxyribose-phosphate aldolase [Anaerosalibacter bizertensis]|uniref:deoxyribose-phosphate aldolase n=1 Tax=Anaerosalibacter bizertensis TaxID=932217 RepID=UPI001D028340|nr:deoxyribose-phosphate aldolase [Anaerosalibacter bizertensis]MBV1819128.1 deoxyribose-phosphate aldolase [Bacteroidales bacterium MSK.15.36]MCB5559739.1 deoxyribose-phosphate aldolase [Anaerosalibacter bizertensis]MCG4582598.1 deoxyribose-phosphate aldolase [Anaerosalibacter bizertensis]MCG4584223.1 deoxyribose-phosphate aldolase [Anaerosalibacter bizertensis]